MNPALSFPHHCFSTARPFLPSMFSLSSGAKSLFLLLASDPLMSLRHIPYIQYRRSGTVTFRSLVAAESGDLVRVCHLKPYSLLGCDTLGVKKRATSPLPGGGGRRKRNHQEYKKKKRYFLKKFIMICNYLKWRWRKERGLSSKFCERSVLKEQKSLAFKV